MHVLGWRYHLGFALLAAMLAASCSGDSVEQANPPRVSVIATTIAGVRADSPALAKEPAQPPQSYVVASGDTLADIANQFGVTPTDIMRASKLTDANRLAVGQKLLIPPPTTTTTTTTTTDSSDASDAPDVPKAPASSTTTVKAPTIAATPAQTYVVRAGDTLASIAQRFEVSAAAIASASKLANPDRLAVGQELTIPELGQSTTAR